MNNYEKNREIAKILGFEFIKPKPENNINFEQVIYPKEWKDEVKCSPVTDIPDFIKMLEQNREIANKFKYGIPTDFSSLM